MAKYKAIFLEPEIFVYVEGRLNAVKSKPSISEQIKSGAKEAEKHNTDRPASPHKGEKDRS